MPPQMARHDTLGGTIQAAAAGEYLDTVPSRGKPRAQRLLVTGLMCSCLAAPARPLLILIGCHESPPFADMKIASSDVLDTYRRFGSFGSMAIALMSLAWPVFPSAIHSSPF